MSTGWHHVPSLLSVAVINTMAESNLEMERFISSYCLSSSMKKSQGRSSRLESGIRSHGGMLLPCLLLRTGSTCLFVDPKDLQKIYLPTSGTTHSGLGPPTSVINQGLPVGQS